MALDNVGLDLTAGVLEMSTQEPTVDPLDVLSAAWLVYSRWCLAMADKSGIVAERQRHLAQLDKMVALTKSAAPHQDLVRPLDGDWMPAVIHLRRLLDEMDG